MVLCRCGLLALMSAPGLVVVNAAAAYEPPIGWYKYKGKAAANSAPKLLAVSGPKDVSVWEEDGGVYKNLNNEPDSNDLADNGAFVGAYEKVPAVQGTISCKQKGSRLDNFKRAAVKNVTDELAKFPRGGLPKGKFQVGVVQLEVEAGFFGIVKPVGHFEDEIACKVEWTAWAYPSALDRRPGWGLTLLAILFFGGGLGVVVYFIIISRASEVDDSSDSESEDDE